MHLYSISEKQQSLVWLHSNKTREEVLQDVELLQEWHEQQLHFPQKLPYDHFLEKILTISKFSLERAKEKLEKLYKLKSKSVDLFEAFEGPSFVLPTQNCLVVLPLPKLGPNNERIYVMNAKSPDSKSFEFDHLVQITISAAELMLKYDQSNSLRAVIDAQNCTFGQVWKISLLKFARLATLLIQGYSCRIIAIDFINVQPAMKILIAIVKTVMKTKLLERIKIHSNLESLHETLDATFLPEEYGGTAGKISEFLDEMDHLVSDNRNFLNECKNYVTAR